MLLPALFGLIIFCGCQLKTTSETNTNSELSWVQDFISEKSAKSVENPPASISKCAYQEETVYYVPAPCCDQYATLYDAEKEVVCYPSGGLTGQGDGRCRDFNADKADCQEIWRDTR